jgi:hypothetical protein
MNESRVPYVLETGRLTLADLSLGVALVDTDIQRLALVRTETDLSTVTENNSVQTLEVWNNGLGLEVSVVDERIYLVAAENPVFEGRCLQDEAEEVLRTAFGPPDRHERLTDVNTVLYWQSGSLAGFFDDGRLQSLYISEPD